MIFWKWLKENWALFLWFFLILLCVFMIGFLVGGGE